MLLMGDGATSPIDLNAVGIATDTWESLVQRDFQAVSVDGRTRAVFKNLEGELIQCIAQADIVVGCVAWLTNERILEALSKTQGVAIAVQKEDFLRPDIVASGGWKSRLHAWYARLPGTLSRYDAGWYETTLYLMSCASDPGIDAVRCVGNHNVSRKPAFPRAHHKFLVFCRKDATEIYDKDNQIYLPNAFTPYQVWTGSFNLTHNATLSLENAIVSIDPHLVHAFFQEAAQVLALSEPLDWDSDWIEPEWRIGT